MGTTLRRYPACALAHAPTFVLMAYQVEKSDEEWKQQLSREE